MFRKVPTRTFQVTFELARENSAQIREATSEFVDVPETDYYLDENGYAIRANGDLVYVFSCKRGNGDRIVRSAIANGAETLDCFDGYLPRLYGRHGFVETRRERNWTEGGPDVVFMQFEPVYN